MAIKELLSVLNANMNLTPTTDSDIHAGMAVARNSSGYAVKADRALNSVTKTYIGLSADDATRTGNGFIQADPVGANGLVAGVFTAENNGLFASAKRAIADYQDESVSNVSDLTSGANGYQGPRRGIGVFTTPSGQFIVDAYNATTTIGVVKSTYQTANEGGGLYNIDAATATLAVNDNLTFGASTQAGAGYLVKVAAADTVSKKVARIDEIKNGLIYITML
jgi:hypothetical protein